MKLLEYFLSHVFGKEEDAETVECISTIVGVASDVKTFERPNIKPDATRTNIVLQPFKRNSLMGMSAWSRFQKNYDFLFTGV